MTVWEPIYAELANKIRWSIASTAKSEGWHYSFQDSMALANVLAGDALKLMKIREEKPDYEFDTKAIRKVLTTT